MIRTFFSALFALFLVATATSTQAASLNSGPQAVRAQKTDLLYPVVLALGVVAGVATANYLTYGSLMGELPALLGVTSTTGAAPTAGAATTAVAPTAGVASAAASTPATAAISTAAPLLPMSAAGSRIFVIASGLFGAWLVGVLYP